MAEPRSLEQRTADTRVMLRRPHLDAWVASAPRAGKAHLVPLSLAWDGERLILAVEATSVTARNIRASGEARLAVGESRDVVMIDADLDESVATADASEAVAAAYADQSDWDPRDAGEGFVYLVLRPRRMQAWREANEISGRTLMRDGAWLSGSAR